MRGRWLFLYGPPASGKTRVGEALARQLDLDLIDLDAEIEGEAGRTVADIFATHGEPDFRARERRALRRLLDRDGGIVALGGGTLLDPSNRERVERTGPVILLDVPGDVLERRVAAAGPTRPLVTGGPERLRDLLASRREHYGSFAVRVDAGGEDPEAVARAVQGASGMLRISGMGRSYDVRVARGLLREAGQHLAAAGCGGPVAVVADGKTGPLFGAEIERSLREAGYETRRVELPRGEAKKNLDAVRTLWEGFLDAGLDRGSTVLALGGGVVSDLAGFAAATFLRGVAWAVAPTSLLAMVDAALGGKTGANLPRGKNLVGSFHPPRLVLTDPDALDTLPDDEFRQGLAEVLKHGVIDDPGLFELCEGGADAVRREVAGLVRRAVAVKVRVVQEDPYERGRRAALNLGHTVGHAVEKVSRYRLRHGDAVAIGLVAEARLSEESGLAESAGLADRIAAAARALGLPDSVPPDLRAEDLLEAMQVDKKRSGSRVRFALPVRVGSVRVGVEVDPELVREVLAR